MNRHVKLLIQKLVINLIIISIGYYFGLVNSESAYGLVIPAFCTVWILNAVVKCVKGIRKENDKSKVEFK